ncbi:hypothetical protein KC945_00080 [Candidatus Saccharibacteria bacterium]|nr:hypothetical protein [Candidatus Saccharibacteria bacterium]
MRRKMVTVLVGLAMVMSPGAVYAETNLVLADDQIQSIRDGCKQAKSVLQQVHSYDALARVNSGQRYENIANRVMAPFISRMAINGINTVALSEASANFKLRIKDFTDAYATYEDRLSKAIKTDCVNHPVEFYADILDARQKRTLVHDAAQQLNTQLEKYRQVFESVIKDHNG